MKENDLISRSALEESNDDIREIVSVLKLLMAVLPRDILGSLMREKILGKLRKLEAKHDR